VNRVSKLIDNRSGLSRKRSRRPHRNPGEWERQENEKTAHNLLEPATAATQQTLSANPVPCTARESRTRSFPWTNANTGKNITFFSSLYILSYATLENKSAKHTAVLSQGKITPCIKLSRLSQDIKILAFIIPCAHKKLVIYSSARDIKISDFWQMFGPTLFHAPACVRSAPNAHSGE